MRISDWSSDVCSSDLPIRELENVEDTLRPVVVIEQHELRGAVEVLVLTALERPEKSNKATDAEAERNRDQIGGHAHWVASRVERKSGVKGRSGSVGVELGGGRIVKKKTIREKT